MINLRTPPGVLVRTVTTGGDGMYNLANVPVGAYLLQEIPPPGYAGGVQIGIQISAGARLLKTSPITVNFPCTYRTSTGKRRLCREIVGAVKPRRPQPAPTCGVRSQT
ncbi:MAG: prealbumin-like fold domain-containing protein [Anaerolineae bacterium]|nr:MAG: prealbumin-like fold domain-containing protein [Anaerolineae bacterium]